MFHPRRLSHSIFVAALAITAWGCGASKKSDTRDEDKKDPKQSTLGWNTINIGPGTGTYRSNDAKRETLWTIQWSSSRADAKKDGNAVLQTVSGDIYSAAKPVSHYVGDRGRVFQAEQRLELIGNVRVVSQDPPGTLTCDELVYEAKLKRIRAVGHVRLESKEGTIGTLSELWATPKLDVVATPDLFPKP